MTGSGSGPVFRRSRAAIFGVSMPEEGAKIAVKEARVERTLGSSPSALCLNYCVPYSYLKLLHGYNCGQDFYSSHYSASPAG